MSHDNETVTLLVVYREKAYFDVVVTPRLESSCHIRSYHVPDGLTKQHDDVVRVVQRFYGKAGPLSCMAWLLRLWRWVTFARGAEFLGYLDRVVLFDGNLFEGPGRNDYAIFENIQRSLRGYRPSLVLATHDEVTDAEAAYRAGAKLVLKRALDGAAFKHLVGTLARQERELYEYRLRPLLRLVVIVAVTILGYFLGALRQEFAPRLCANWHKSWAGRIECVGSPEQRNESDERVQEFELVVSNLAWTAVSDIEVRTVPEMQPFVISGIGSGYRIPLVQAKQEQRVKFRCAGPADAFEKTEWSKLAILLGRPGEKCRSVFFPRNVFSTCRQTVSPPASACSSRPAAPDRTRPG